MLHPGAINLLAIGNTLSEQKHRSGQHRTQHRIEYIAWVFLVQHQWNGIDARYITLQDIDGSGTGARAADNIHQWRCHVGMHGGETIAATHRVFDSGQGQVGGVGGQQGAFGTNPVQLSVNLALDIQPFKYGLGDQVGIGGGQFQVRHQSNPRQGRRNILLSAISTPNQECGQALKMLAGLLQVLLTDIVHHHVVARDCRLDGVKAAHITSADTANRPYFLNRHGISPQSLARKNRPSQSSGAACPAAAGWHCPWPPSRAVDAAPADPPGH